MDISIVSRRRKTRTEKWKKMIMIKNISGDQLSTE